MALRPPTVSNPPPYFDVAADNKVTPLDALQVIDESVLRRRGQISGLPNSRVTLPARSIPRHRQRCCLSTRPTTPRRSRPCRSHLPQSRRWFAYFDVVNQQFRSGVVSVTVLQTNPDSIKPIYSHLLVGDLPQPGSETGARCRRTRGLQGSTG